MLERGPDDAPSGAFHILVAMILIALCLLAATNDAKAQQGIFSGVQIRRISDSAAREVVPSLQATTEIQPGSREFAWGIYSLLYNYSDTDGESVALYGQAYKFGLAPTWGGVFEAQCPNTKGYGCFGAEIDVMGSGNTPRLTEGLQMVVGKARGAEPGVARIHHAIDVVAMNNDTNEVVLEQGMRFGLPCSANCLQIPSNSSVNLDGGIGDVEIVFNDKTGNAGFCNKRQNQWVLAANFTTHQPVTGACF